MKRFDHVFVLFAFDGAGGIDELAAGFEDAHGVTEKEFLLCGELVDVLPGDPPAYFGVAAKRARAGAGGVDEDAIEDAVFEG